MTPKTIIWQDGSNNTPGIIQAVAVVRHSDVKTWPSLSEPDPAASTGDIEDLQVLTDDLVLKDDVTAKTIYLTDESGDLIDELQGETDGKSFKHTLKFLHPGEGNAPRGFANWCKNHGLVFLIKRKDNGLIYMMGSEHQPVKISKSAGTLGMKASDRKGREFEFVCNGTGPCPELQGDVMIKIGAGTQVAQASLFSPLA